MKPWEKLVVGAMVGLLLIAFLHFVLLWFALAPESWDRRRARFEQAEARGMTVADAIKAYSIENGAPPPTLQALVPQFLSGIPDTGLEDYPAFEYEVFTNTSTVRTAPWELRIQCPRGGLNWDVFFYWPTEDYPNQIYGGMTESIGRWAYVHE